MVRFKRHMSKSIKASRFQILDSRVPNGRNSLFGMAVLFALSFSNVVRAQDFSNLQNVPKVEKTVPLTRGFKHAADAPSTRSYRPDRGIVIIEQTDGTTKEEPYVILPILFKVDSDELLNATSQSNLERLAEFLKLSSLRDARFCVEGHTSTSF
jgi:outer membrane protein OmpA-like peptidoglycan-associated protein